MHAWSSADASSLLQHLGIKKYKIEILVLGVGLKVPINTDTFSIIFYMYLHYHIATPRLLRERVAAVS